MALFCPKSWPRWVNRMCVRLMIRRSRVHPIRVRQHSFVEIWSWNIFYCNSLPSTDVRRAAVSFWRKNVHRYLLNVLSYFKSLYTVGFKLQGPVVQSVVSLTTSLRVISLTVLADSKYNILIFFAEIMWVAFALQKLLTFFQQKISEYLRITWCKF